MAREIKIRSRIFSYNEEDAPENDVEQHLTIKSDGHVELQGYKFNYHLCNLEPSRHKELDIGAEKAEELISDLSRFTFSQLKTKPECGVWDLILTEDGEEKAGSGYMMPEYLNKLLSKSTREKLPMLDDLFLFDDEFDVDDGYDSWNDNSEDWF